METNLTSSFQRAPLSKDLEPLQKTFKELLPILESNPDWYGSIYFERKAAKSLLANLKQTQISDQITTGAVFRIYDGYTLYEEATDDFELEADQLKSFVQNFAKRVLSQSRVASPHSKLRPYKPPTWKQRLTEPLEKEITSQIPDGVDPNTPVHFGIRYQEDPRHQSTAEGLASLKKIIEKCQAIALQPGSEVPDLSYVMARQSLVEEESIFIDRETQMSQTLYRMSLAITVMAGVNRTFLRVGGLGGLDSLHYKESELVDLLKKLKALKSASRLEPGKYRVLFSPALTGVLAHEAFGHAQEADTCARGRSKAWELQKTGQEVGNQHATILNNPAIYANGTEGYAAWGSYFFDEEGWLAKEQVLLDHGKLLVPMTNLTSAIRLDIPRTANGKRESWANGVYARQTNTYFSAGDKTFKELMSQLDHGFVATHCAGGMEDPKGMGIQVGISYLEEVKQGKLTGKVFRGPAGGDIQMTGYTPDVLNSIMAKSKIEFDSEEPDTAIHPYNDVGGCGKYHKESVYAGCGGPYVLLDQVILG
jgi:TldD protein